MGGKVPIAARGTPLTSGRTHSPLRDFEGASIVATLAYWEDERQLMAFSGLPIARHPCPRVNVAANIAHSGKEAVWGWAIAYLSVLATYFDWLSSDLPSQG